MSGAETGAARAHVACRICSQELPPPGLDFGPMPAANAFLDGPEDFADEAEFPLALCRCPACGLLQLDHVVPAEHLYRDYLYVSGTSEAVHRHAASLARRFGPGVGGRVVEIASNDGSVLRAFADTGAKVLGVEPAAEIAATAEAAGVPTVRAFFGAELGARLAQDHGRADRILARHVFAHVDDIHGFLRGARALLDAKGRLLIEVPYLGRLYEQLAFDTIYHEHLSYFALTPVVRLCRELDLRLVDVELVDMHGGSLLMSIEHDRGQEVGAAVRDMVVAEEREGLIGAERFAAFVAQVQRWRRDFEALIAELDEAGARVVGYGAAAKANTMLGWCRESAASITAILDKSPLKQGRFTPGAHLPVEPPEAWRRLEPSHMIIFAWNLEAEIRRQMSDFAEAGGRFVIPVPRPRVLP